MKFISVACNLLCSELDLNAFGCELTLIYIRIQAPRINRCHRRCTPMTFRSVAIDSRHSIHFHRSHSSYPRRPCRSFAQSIERLWLRSATHSTSARRLNAYHFAIAMQPLRYLCVQLVSMDLVASSTSTLFVAISFRVLLVAADVGIDGIGF